MTTKNKANSATAALILGILSLFFWFIPLFGLPISIVGLVLGAKGMSAKKRFAVSALVCSIIGLCLTMINGALGVYLAMEGKHAIVNALFNSSSA